MRLTAILILLFLSAGLCARLPDLIPYRKGNLWGYCDSTKKIVIEPQWELTTPFIDGRAVVKFHGLYGLIDSAGKPVTQYIYASIDQHARNGKRVASNKKHKVGLIDQNGVEIIPFKYSRIYWETDKYLRVYDRGSYGELDSAGRVIVPLDYVSTYPEQGYLFGESARCGYFVFSKGSGYDFGVVDSLGNVIIPFQYDHVLDFGGGYFSMGRPTPDSTYNYTFYLFDRRGKQINENQLPKLAPLDIRFFPYPARDSSMNIFYRGWTDDMYYRNVVHEEKLLFAGYFHYGLARFMTMDSLWGFKSEEFENVIPPKYGYCTDFSTEGLAAVYPKDHVYPRKRSRKDEIRDRFDVEHRRIMGYIDYHGTEYWEN